MIYQVIIIGSGPSGVAAALGFAENGIVPFMLDVGFEAPDIEPIDSNFYNYRKTHDSFEIMIGKNYEGLQNVIYKQTPSPKVSSPFMHFVTKGANELSPLEEKGSPVLQSFAQGGMANAWGAGLYRCSDSDLANHTIKSSDLSPYYDKLTQEIGISGDNDDLTRFFGSTDNLLPPLRLSKKAEKIYLKYKSRKNRLNDKGVYIGRPRLGVLSENYDNRAAYDYHNLDMWIPNLPYIYTPAYTLQKLIRDNQVIYQKSVLVKRWTRENNHLIVYAENINDGSEISFKCKRLILAAGAINSSKIVLNSKKDFKTKLPLIDKTLVQFPLILPSFIGSTFEEDAFALTNLNILFELKQHNMRLQGSIIELSSPARSVFYEMFPFAARNNLTLIRLAVPSVLVLFLWFPPDIKRTGYLKLLSGGKLEVESPVRKIDKTVIKEIVRDVNSLGVFTHSLLVKPPTHSLQYAGTMPMVENPDREYHCNKVGEIYREPGVHVVDGALFSYIPAKNFSFTIMANAMRIADQVSKGLKKQ